MGWATPDPGRATPATEIGGIMRKMAELKYRGGAFLIQGTQAPDVFTPEDLSEEQRMIAQTAHDFAVEKVRPYAEAIEHHEFDHTVRLMREAGELGLLGADVPEEFGGVGLDKISSMIIKENLVAGGSFIVTVGAHTGIGTLPIVFFGTVEQKKKYLPDLASGQKIAAYALTEPGSGSDALGAKTTAVLSPDGKHYLLNGEKQWITNAGFADVFVVYAKIDGDKFTTFIVDRDAPGVSVGAEEKKLGIKGSSTRSLILQDAKVPVENLLGEIGRGHVIAFNILNIGRFKLAGGAVGSCKHTLALATEYAKVRQQFGQPLANFTLIQGKLADMAVKTYAAESAAYRTGGLLDAHLADLDPHEPDSGRQAAKRIEEYAIECSINKVLASEVLDFVADEAVQIHGGYGYMQEYEVERIYRDARINRIFEGTNEVNRLLIPGTLMRRAMKGEIPVMAALKTLQDELMNLTPPELDESPLALECSMIDRAKKMFLMVAGLAVQKYQFGLEKEQEVLALLADMAIEIFAAESGLLRALKHGGETRFDLATIYAHEAADRVAALARTALAHIEDGDTLRAQLSIVKRLARHDMVDLIGLKRRVAARVIEAGKYVV